MRFLSSLILSVALFWSVSVKAEGLSASSQQEIVKATLVTEHSALVPGKPLNAAVLLEAQKGWHTYWENPGDAGMATSFTWKLPTGFTANAIQWPAPSRVAEGPLVTHSYYDTVFLPVTIRVPASLDSNQSYPVRVKATWLVCKDICIPESAEMEISLPVTTSAPAPTEHASLFAQHRAKAVQPFRGRVTYALQDNQIVLSVPLDSFKQQEVRSAVFFPRQPNMINYAAEQEVAIHDNVLRLTLARTNDEPAKNSSGILSVTFGDQSVRHYNISLLPASAAAAVAASTPEAGSPVSTGWLAAVLLAFFGGIILNLMPCVLPVLSLKTLAVVKKAGESPATVKKLGLSYTLGILFSFTLIAGALLALREAGEVVGWGYQMQSTPFVAFLIYLLFLVGLNLSGLFDLPVMLGDATTGVNESSAVGSFYTGILAAAVATPCTAPFMASAVGVALTMPDMQALLIFEALGLGLAAPFLLISLYPKLLRFLPKPGAWMERFKQFLAFPMYASVIWLIWVLTLQTNPTGTVIVLSGMLAILLILWLRHFFESGSIAYRLLALISLLAIMSYSISMLEEIETAPDATAMHMSTDVDAVPYSRENLARLLAQGKPVFVNATAAWCITCQVNAKVAIDTSRTQALFREKGVTLMIADWTRRNNDITELLSSHGYKGVPLYIYYPPNKGQPQILPQLLTEDIIRNAINQQK